MEIYYGILFIAAIAYLLICFNCAQTGKDRGLNYGDIFAIAFFASPVVGYLHMIVVLNHKKMEDVEETVEQKLEKNI